MNESFLLNALTYPAKATYGVATSIASSPKTQSVVSGVGNSANYLASTGLGQKALGLGAGLLAARAIADRIGKKKEKEKEENNIELSKPNTRKFDWLNRKRPTYEQSENLPRYPELSFINKIPRNPRSLVSLMTQRKPNNYDRNIQPKEIDRQVKIASKGIDRNEAQTGYDRVIGKLSA